MSQKLSTSFFASNRFEQRIKDFVYGFIQYLQTQKRYSKHSCDSYIYDIVSFLFFLRDKREAQSLVISHIEELTVRDFRSWLAERLEDHSNTSNARALSALRSFFKYLWQIN